MLKCAVHALYNNISKQVEFLEIFRDAVAQRRLLKRNILQKIAGFYI